MEIDKLIHSSAELTAQIETFRTSKSQLEARVDELRELGFSRVGIDESSQKVTTLKVAMLLNKRQKV